MVTPAELLRVLLMPLIVSAIIAMIGRWRMWPWCAPLAAGAGFLTGYAAYFGYASGRVLGLPHLPPQDGTDWLFWLAIPLTILGVLIAKFGGRWGWVLGLAAGAIAYVVVRPLVPTNVPAMTAAGLALGFGAAGVVLSLTTRFAAGRMGAWAPGLALSGVVGAAAVVVMSSNLRIVGVYGIAAAAALGPAGLLGPPKLRGFGPVAAGLLAGLLTGGRVYPDPGVTWTNLVVLTAAPLLLLPAACLPFKRAWVRGVVGVLLVAIAAAVVSVPTAIAAKHAAEDDPYATGE